jgi:hypothetical protein
MNSTPIDGYKKYSALLITIATTLVTFFITSAEEAAVWQQLLATGITAASGIAYLIVQGRIDAKKVTAATLPTATTATAPTAIAAVAASTPTQPTAAAETTAPAELDIDFDVKSFHQAVLDTVKIKYTEVNPSTIFYRARDLGMSMVCQSLTQAVQYWQYLVSLAYDAEAWFKEMDEKKKGQCGRSVEYYEWQRDFSLVLQDQQNLYKLQATNIDWRSKFVRTPCTLYKVGGQAGDILAHA